MLLVLFVVFVVCCITESFSDKECNIKCTECD